MIQSLSGTAQDLVQSLILDPRSSAEDIFALLDVTFGTVEDSQELLAQYLNLFQDKTECASDLLQKLFVKLMKILDCRGISSDDMEGYLIRQFCRGCRDDDLLNIIICSSSVRTSC